MARYQVILTYDGTEFFGFQRQVGVRTVQGVTETALGEIGWQGRSILASGRTDTGVHAEGQVIAFDLDWEHEVAELQAAINANLPPDVAAQAVNHADRSFHPRFDAVSRCYQYNIYADPARKPLKDRWAWRVWPEPDVSRLREASSILEGTHDFAAFGTAPKSGGSTIRSVFHAGWSAEGENLVFEIIANAFLTHMVRRLVYHLVEIGTGRREILPVEQYIENRETPLLQGLAPPQGLILKRVNYLAD